MAPDSRSVTSGLSPAEAAASGTGLSGLLLFHVHRPPSEAAMAQHLD